jgi:maltooligosyltrehalose trehalohydrolase
MNLLPLDLLGARERSPGVLDFGVVLPWVTAGDGNRLWVKVIHEQDQFLKDVQPLAFEMMHASKELGDYWSTQVDTRNRPGGLAPRSAWGKPGRYVYRYSLKPPGTAEEIDWIIDPYAREFGVGKLSAVTLGYEAHEWSATETTWKTPQLDDLVMYELMINEFAGGIDGTIDRLDYLADLGVNCVEVMPVSNVSATVDWGFLPSGYFGVDERFGKRRDLQRLIDAAHQRGIAVILDVVYGHTAESFPYCYLYRKLHYRENPFMGPFAKDYFGESTDWTRPLTQDFFLTVNHHWLDAYHVDGFRYDCVPNYWDGALGSGYANLVYSTYQLVKSKKGGGGHWQRFFGNGSEGAVNLVQCAEQLEGPVEILEKTYSNSTWQNETLGAAEGVAKGSVDDLGRLGARLGLDGYPREATHGGDTLDKTALQYIENHDHSRFVCNFGTTTADNELLGEGLRDHWYKVQPHLIGLFTGCGIPMLWQGQEFGENYWLPYQGFGRVAMFRPVRWDYFYDEIGRSTIWLVRALIDLRRRAIQFRRGDYYFHNHFDNYQSRRVLLFSRTHGDDFSLVAINLGDQDQTVPFTFPAGGDYREELHGYGLTGVAAGVETSLTVPSNYGRIWTLVRR